MAQQVEFPSIPGTKPQEYPTVIQGLMAFVNQENPDFRELKRYMRSRSIFDKDSAAQLFELLDIKVTKNKGASLGQRGKESLEISSPDEWKKALFRELARRNEILVKYVFDALAERLYSINEMYRVITSYVYPGKTLTLTSFKNWMGWIEATGMIKYIGIRWGPSPLAKDIETYLNSIDIEDLLEEEAEEEEEDEDGGADALGTAFDDAADSEAETPELTEDEAFDAPPGGVPSLDDDFDESDTAPGHGARRAAAAQAPALMPYRAALTLRSIAEIQEVQKVLELDPAGGELAERAAALDEAEIASNMEGLRDLWHTAKNGKPLAFEDFSIDPGDYKKRGKKGKKGFFLYRALVAATCAYRPAWATGSNTSPAHKPAQRFGVLDGSGALTNHYYEGQTLDDVLSGLVASGHAERLDVLALIPYLGLARQALLDADSWAAKCEKAKDIESLWKDVYERLHAGVFTVELVWVVREMARSGLWPLEDLRQTGVVPTQEVLDIAFRIGLVSTPYLGDFASVLYASKMLTGYCGADHGWEASLLHFGRQMGCDYNCRNRATCAYFCKEKLRR